MFNRKLKQYFCRHNFVCIAKHKFSSQNLWKCKKCGVYLVQHWGIGAYFVCKESKLNLNKEQWTSPYECRRNIE